MKQYLIALSLLLALNMSAAGVKPQHRHHPAVTAVDTTRQDEVEAFSDTTATSYDADTDSVSEAAEDEDSSSILSPIPYADSFIKGLIGGTVGIGAVIFAIFIVLLVFLTLVSPLIVVILIIRHLIKQNNAKVTIAEKAIEAGQPIPEAVRPQATESSDLYRKKGIQNCALGVGIVITFSIWGFDTLMALGFLLLCFGIGQLIIAKTSK